MLVFANVLLLYASLAFAQKMRNIDYLSYGYDIFRSNPLNTFGGIDPGFQIQKIFNFTYEMHQKMKSGRSQIVLLLLETYISTPLESWDAKFKGSLNYRLLKNAHRSIKNNIQFQKVNAKFT